MYVHVCVCSKFADFVNCVHKFITGFSTTLYLPVDPPQITHHPTSQLDVVPGSTMKFTITAAGGGDLTYKWQWDGADLDSLPGVSGETTSTLKIDNVKKKHKGTYTCIVSNAAGPTPSNPAQLTVRKFLYPVVLIQQYRQPSGPLRMSMCVYVCVCIGMCVRVCMSVCVCVKAFEINTHNTLLLGYTQL